MTRVAGFVVVALLVAAQAEGGAQGIPCSNPFVFADAAVNVVVLPYDTPAGLPAGGDLGTKLSALMQMEVLRSIANLGSVGAVQMVGSAADCNPDLVVSKLLGTTPGAAARLTPGSGLIVVWGRFYRRGDDVFVQTYCRLLRPGVDETVEVTLRDRPFSAQVSGQAFACPPRRVTVTDLMEFERQFLRSTIVRTTPQDGASGTPLPSEPMPYWISDTQGDWMKITVRNGPRGWVRLSGARDAWSLTRWLPELDYIQGMAGYLRTRVAVKQGTTARPEWIASAHKALADYVTYAEPLSQAATDDGGTSRTSMAAAVAFQLRGILELSKPNATAAERDSARQLFERAGALVPDDGHAKALVAVGRIAGDTPGRSLKDTADGLLRALGADPGNTRLLANLQSAYELLLAPAAVSALTEAERTDVAGQLEAIRRLRVTRKGA